MATSLSTFRPATIRCSSSSDTRRTPQPPFSASWWTPLFGWSSDPDYISNGTGSGSKSSDPSEIENVNKQSRSRFTPGCFTEEKAKQLRMKTMETATFHDLMYHSAIASRLASDVSGKYDF